MDWILVGGDVIREGHIARDDLAISNGAIAETPAHAARRFDARGLVLAPGICDVHGDAFERNLSPRPGVQFAMEAALVETARQLVANGITTAYLALTISWEPGLRSLDNARRLIRALAHVEPELRVDMRVQLRWEVFALDAIADVEAWLNLTPRPVLAFNDHLGVLLEDDRLAHKVPDYAARAGLDETAYEALVERVAARSGETPAAMARLAAAADRAGVATFAHDERTPDERRRHRSLGIKVSEFPLTDATAQEAADFGEATVLGAPNVLRGGSHHGAVDAEPAIEDGRCGVLASDYFYPAQLQAVAKLCPDGGDDMARAWDLISLNAARACGLDDRGRLAPGQRADVVALRRHAGGLSVEAVFAGGRAVYVTDPSRFL